MFRIKKLDIFIAKQFLLLFVATFFICQFVLMMQFLWRYVDDLIGKGLSMDVMAQFFWYMGVMLVPQAFPLAILLSSLITFGNLGESSELTAIKAAGISLMQAMRSILLIVLIVTGVSFYFQNVIGPDANKSFRQLLMSMKQKSPELEIPEGMFYDGIPSTNLYVTKKDMQTGKLYGIIIYRMTGSYEDQAIILADSGMLQSTADKKHLLLTLWSGEWFENMRSQDIVGSAEVPYRRETFSTKQIVQDFDSEFNLADASGASSNAQSKSLGKILHDLDSIRQFNDSVSHSFLQDAQRGTFFRPVLDRKDSADVMNQVASGHVSLDSLFGQLAAKKQLETVKSAMEYAKLETSNIRMKAEYTRYLNRQERLHQLEAINKFTLALSCVLFFFIGAPLGAIIRKGGLGVPVIISVLVFIVYYIFDNSGARMARDGNWGIWFGKLIATGVLTPLAIFFTYKANNDSTVFNMDSYRQFFMRLLGTRMKRNITRKEVIINDPDYRTDADRLETITEAISQYNQSQRLLRWPNPVKVFFREGDDHRIQDISDELEMVIEDLSNTKDKVVLTELNHYPILATHAHTRPFRRRWLNAVTGIIVPLGLFFYFRMLRFRFRLYKDLRTIRRTNDAIVERVRNAYI